MKVINKIGLDKKQGLEKNYRMHMRFNQELVTRLTDAAKDLGVTRTAILEQLVVWFLNELESERKQNENQK